MGLTEKPIGEGSPDAPAVIEPEGYVTVVEQQTKAEIDRQIATAKRYPRSLTMFKERLSNAVRMDKATAQSCFYTVPRAGKRITGPSVRLGELAASLYQNVRYGGRVVDIDDKYVTAQGVFHDLENNVYVQIEVKRRITDSEGRRYSDDMIVTASNAAVAIAKRNAIIGGIPRPLMQEAYELSQRVAIGEAKDLKTAVTATLSKAFALNVTPEQVFVFLGVDGAPDITTGHLLDLVGALTAIETGEETIQSVFPAADAGAAPVTGRRTFGKRKPATTSVTPPEPAQPAPTTAPAASAGPTTAPDPNRAPKMSSAALYTFWKKAEELCGSRSKAMAPVEQAVVKLRGYGKLAFNCLGFQDLSDADSLLVLAKLEEMVAEK